MEPIIFVPLTRGKVAVIDFEDRWLLQWKWHAVRPSPNYENWYAECAHHKNETTGEWVTMTMHRLIASAIGRRLVDHRDRNGLNNTRGNLRLATSSLNIANSGRRAGKVGSKFKGVHPCPRNCHRRKPWRAAIKVDYRQIHLGTFAMEAEAAEAYDAAALKYFGEFALTNAALGLLLQPEPAQPQTTTTQ